MCCVLVQTNRPGEPDWFVELQLSGPASEAFSQSRSGPSLSPTASGEAHYCRDALRTTPSTTSVRGSMYIQAGLPSSGLTWLSKRQLSPEACRQESRLSLYRLPGPGPLPQWPPSPRRAVSWEVGLEESTPRTLLGGVLGSQAGRVAWSFLYPARASRLLLVQGAPGSIPQICPALGTLYAVIAQTLSPRKRLILHQQRRATGRHNLPSRT